MNITIADAISSLNPNVSFSVDKDIIVAWDLAKKGHTKPTDEEINAELTRLQAAYDAQAYARSRANEYPSIGDQLDMIYHNGDGGATFQAAIKAVKDKYPKE